MWRRTQLQISEASIHSGKCVGFQRTLAFGTSISEEDVPVFGIQNITAGDIKYFNEHGYICKLLMNAGQTEAGAYAYVEPTLSVRRTRVQRSSE